MERLHKKEIDKLERIANHKLKPLGLDIRVQYSTDLNGLEDNYCFWVHSGVVYPEIIKNNLDSFSCTHKGYTIKDLKQYLSKILIALDSRKGALYAAYIYLLGCPLNTIKRKTNLKDYE